MADKLRILIVTEDDPLYVIRLFEVFFREYPRDRFEVEMLYGIRTDQQRRLAAAGHPTRTLIAYGEYWYPWYVRRLAERPANVLFVLRQVVPW